MIDQIIQTGGTIKSQLFFNNERDLYVFIIDYIR